MSDKTLPGSYISVADFTSAATGIDPAALPAGELARIIFRASRRADRICKQVLYSTLDTVQLLEDRSPEGYSVDLSDGQLKFFPKRFPIRSVTSLKQFFSAANTPSAIPSTQIHIDSSARWGWVEGVWSSYKRQFPPMYLELTYVNGWLATPLATPSSNGGPSGVGLLTLVAQPGNATVQGVYAGQALEIQDATPEVVTVQSVSGNVVTLTAALANSHGLDSFVVEPQFNELSFADVQQAVILIASHFIKQKGIAPLVLKNESIEPQQMRSPDGGLYDEAVDLLVPFTVQF